jgi:hypothetical protein
MHDRSIHCYGAILYSVIALFSVAACAQGVGGKAGIGGKSGIGGGSTVASAPTYVADVTNTSACAGGPTTCAAAAITPVTGDEFTVFVYHNTGTTISGVADTCGTSGGGSNTYGAADFSNTSAQLSSVYHVIVGYGKSCVVTATFGSPSGNAQIVVVDSRGTSTSTPVVAATIGNQNTPGTGTNAITSNAGQGSNISTGANTNTLVIGSVVTCYGNADTFSHGTGFTIGSTNTTVGNCNVAVEYETQSATSTTIAATFTTTGGTNLNYHTMAVIVQHP